MLSSPLKIRSRSVKCLVAVIPSGLLAVHPEVEVVHAVLAVHLEHLPVVLDLVNEVPDCPFWDYIPPA